MRRKLDNDGTPVKINEGKTDRIIRLVAGVALLLLAVVALKGALGIAAGIVGAVLLLTGAVGFCPLYRVFGVNTCRVR